MAWNAAFTFSGVMDAGCPSESESNRAWISSVVKGVGRYSSAPILSLQVHLVIFDRFSCSNGIQHAI